MKETQQYIITDDTTSIFETINPSLKSEQMELAIREYVVAIENIFSTSLNQELELQLFPEEIIKKRLTDTITERLADPETACLSLDRFLLTNLEASFPDRILRFSLTRNLNGNKYPRQGNVSFGEQVSRLYQGILDLDKKKIILVDDGMFSGSTIQDFLTIWQREAGKRLPVTDIITFTGNVCDIEGINIQVLSPVDYLYDWVDLRDLGPWGGKQNDKSRNNRVTTQIPYIYPWSNGKAASLDMDGNFFDMSKRILDAAVQLVNRYELISGTSLRFRDMVQRGFSLPVDQRKTIPISINQRVSDYLEQCFALIEQEEQREVVIFDMDGTLYQLDGDDNSYKNSTLEQQVLDNARTFIANRLCNGNEIEAEIILQRGLNDSVGISMYLEQKFSLPRSTYFSTVWNINPEGIVQNYESALQTLKDLRIKKPQAKCILLTAAPRVWAEQVLNYLNIGETFEIVYTGEQYKQKREIFALLSQRYTPANIVSVGDQYRSDIQPAEEMGMRGVLLEQPKDITKVLEVL